MQLPAVIPEAKVHEHEANDHEAKCRRCGVTCHFAIEVGAAKYVIPEIHCRFLGRAADGHYQCTVYDRRFELAPWCHTAVDALTQGALATDCPYAADTPGYKGREWAPADVRAKLAPIVRQRLLEQGLPLSGNPDSALQALDGGPQRWAYKEQDGRFVFYSKDTRA